MNETLLYRVLTAVGALLAVASGLLAVLVALQGIDLGFPSDVGVTGRGALWLAITSAISAARPLWGSPRARGCRWAWWFC